MPNDPQITIILNLIHVLVQTLILSRAWGIRSTKPYTLDVSFIYTQLFTFLFHLSSHFLFSSPAVKKIMIPNAWVVGKTLFPLSIIDASLTIVHRYRGLGTVNYVFTTRKRHYTPLKKQPRHCRHSPLKSRRKRLLLKCMLTWIRLWLMTRVPTPLRIAPKMRKLARQWWNRPERMGTIQSLLFQITPSLTYDVLQAWSENLKNAVWLIYWCIDW